MSVVLFVMAGALLLWAAVFWALQRIESGVPMTPQWRRWSRLENLGLGALVAGCSVRAYFLFFALVLLAGCVPAVPEAESPTDEVPNTKPVVEAAAGDSSRWAGRTFKVYQLEDGSRCAVAQGVRAVAIDCDWRRAQ